MLAGDLVGRFHALRHVIPGGIPPYRPPAVFSETVLPPEVWDRSGLVAQARAWLYTRGILTPKDVDELSAYYGMAAQPIAEDSAQVSLDRVRATLKQASKENVDHEEAAFRVHVVIFASGQSPLADWHADLIANMAVVNAAGAASYESLTDPRLAGIIPFFRYVTQNDERVRPAHRLLHNKFYRRDDPIWRRIWPPNGYNCRCYVRGVTIEQVRTYGIVQDRVPKGAEPDPGFAVPPASFVKKNAGGRAAPQPATRARRTRA